MKGTVGRVPIRFHGYSGTSTELRLTDVGGSLSDANYLS